MNTLRFKTNLKCNGCIQAIKPGLSSIPEIESWSVLLDVQDKILEVDFESGSEDELTIKIKNEVTKAGYQIEQI